jgi:hypothetical protein
MLPGHPQAWVSVRANGKRFSFATNFTSPPVGSSRILAEATRKPPEK